MTKTQAIKQTRAEVTELTTWSETYNAWWTCNTPPNVNPIQHLKQRKICYALELLGVDEYYAWDYAGNCYGISFRDAVYSYPTGDNNEI